MFEIVFNPLFAKLNEIEEPKPFYESYETPLRARLTWEYLRKIGYASRDFGDTILITNPDKNLVVKLPEPLEKEDICRVHSRYHVQLVEKFSNIGAGQLGNLVQATPDTFEIALLSAGGAYTAIKDVYERKYSQSFAIIRPPGHHAIPDSSDGLCVFNNIAVAIKKLRNDFDFKGKIAILDFDAHYGDGLAKIFYEDPSVLYSSIHEFDFGTGEAGYFSELGSGKGLGYNINFPIPLKGDDSYFMEYCEFIEPLLEQYSPEIIIVAAGFDGHWSDPLGNLSYTSQGYRFFAEWLKKIAAKICGGRVSFCLEGGYNLLIIPRLIETVISQFNGLQIQAPIDDAAFSIFHTGIPNENKNNGNEEIADNFKALHKKKTESLKKTIKKLWS